MDTDHPLGHIIGVVSFNVKSLVSGNFRFDYGYEHDYDYEILSLKISNC